MNRWGPTDVITAILTFAISVAVIMSIMKPYITGKEISVESAKLLSTLMGSVVSIISMYIGAKIQKRKDQ